MMPRAALGVARPVHGSFAPLAPHVVNMFSFSVRSVPSTGSLRLCPCLSHSSRVNGLNVEPGAKPLDAAVGAVGVEVDGLVAVAGSPTAA